MLYICSMIATKCRRNKFLQVIHSNNSSSNMIRIYNYMIISILLGGVNDLSLLVASCVDNCNYVETLIVLIQYTIPVHWHLLMHRDFCV